MKKLRTQRFKVDTVDSFHQFQFPAAGLVRPSFQKGEVRHIVHIIAPIPMGGYFCGHTKPFIERQPFLGDVFADQGVAPSPEQLTQHMDGRLQPAGRPGHQDNGGHLVQSDVYYRQSVAHHFPAVVEHLLPGPEVGEGQVKKDALPAVLVHHGPVFQPKRTEALLFFHPLEKVFQLPGKGYFVFLLFPLFFAVPYPCRCQNMLAPYPICFSSTGMSRPSSSR